MRDELTPLSRDGSVCPKGEGTGFERDLRRTDFKHVGGWELDIVEDLSSRWGVHEGPTHVWFEPERCEPRLGEPDRQPHG